MDEAGNKLADVVNIQAREVVYYLRKDRDAPQGKEEHLEKI